MAFTGKEKEKYKMIQHMDTQPCAHRRKRRMSHVFVVTIALVIALGAIVWILSLENVIQSSWSGILGVIFTFLGVIFGLLQWHLQRATGTPVVPPPAQPSQAQHPYWQQETTGEKGVLIVHAHSRLRGATVRLNAGIDKVNLKTAAASNVVKREEHGHTVYTSVFPSLEPGDYTAYVDSRPLMAKVSIRAGHVAEIDWR
jgi:hypothetical protein